MSSVSLRGIDEKLGEALKSAAEKENKSVNQWMLDVLRQRLGLAKEKRFTKKYDDLDALFGRWNEDEFDRIEQKINSESKIDDELWK